MARLANPYDIRDLVPGEAPMTEENVRRVNTVKQLTRRFHDGTGRAAMEYTEIARIAFEEGVDAGMKAKDEEWRERIKALHLAHWPVSDYSSDPSGLVDWFIKELLSGRDIE